MKQLAIVCPTRNRPTEALRMYESAVAHSNADVLFYVDSDDPRVIDYSEGFSRICNGRGKFVFAKPIGRGLAVNDLIDHYRDYRMYLVVSDDIVFTRSGWEEQAIEAMDSFGDDIGLVHLASENGEPWVNWAIVSRKWIDTLGWFNYPGCKRFCQDTILQVLAESINRIVRIEPQCLHHHVMNADGYMEDLKSDAEATLWYFAKNFHTDLEKLRGALTR